MRVVTALAGAPASLCHQNASRQSPLSAIGATARPAGRTACAQTGLAPLPRRPPGPNELTRNRGWHAPVTHLPRPDRLII